MDNTCHVTSHGLGANGNVKLRKTAHLTTCIETQQQQSLLCAQKFTIDKYTQGENINNKKMSTAT